MTHEQRQERIELRYHGTIWQAANDWMEAERAIEEARDVCTLLLSQDEKERDAARWVAEKWLERFGR